jgi:galactarate dehydratase
VRDGPGLTAGALPAAQGSVCEMAWDDAYLQRGSVDPSASTTPGNKAGGLSNIVEKAMGSIVNSGAAPIGGVPARGKKRKTRCMTHAAAPASDCICGPLQRAAGMKLPGFTTGRRNSPGPDTVGCAASTPWGAVRPVP